jgi:hypothetical protein
VGAEGEQEAGLAGEAGDFQAGIKAGLGGQTEVDEGRQVGQAGPDEGVEVGAVAVVADQGALRAVGEVVLASRVAVVDEQGQAAVQGFGDG